ncbi:ABC transporter permease subunit [Halopiger djelfimassiliensis]|uniref:ABC transporter permease subunit n=1 Tax=Halopiger djelfimassiliensis TaxID=1293047 RepID=UPI000677BA77|nr:ABC transporter permease subunit [Halopiger djelfimassiliensis]
MSTLDVARKDFLDTRRSKVIWLVIFIYTGFVGLLMFIQQDQLEYHETLRAGVVSNLNNIVGLGAYLIPIVALVAAYLAIAGERETGSAKFLLGLPNTRRDVIVGKFLSRSLVIALGITSAYLVAAGLLVTVYPLFPVTPFGVMFGMMLLYAVAYVAVAIGISASVTSKARAAAVGFGLYFVLNVLPIFILPGDIVRKLHTDVLGASESPVLYHFVSQLVPLEALTRGIRPVTNYDMMGGPLPEDAPFYVQPEFMPVVLCVWIVVPLVIGYYRFRSADVS